MNIVIVEDDRTIRENLHEILEAYDYQVNSYADGLQGLNGIRNTLPDLVVCDIMLPQMDGYKILEKLKTDEKTANIPFIFLTARSDRADQRKGMELGADDFIVKPFTTQELLNAIEARLQKRKHAEHKIQSAVNEKLQTFSKINSHEYNTPLNGIIGLTGTLIDHIEQLSKEEVVEIAKAIRTSSKRLYRTFKNFLLYIQIQREELNSPKSIVDHHWIENLAADLFQQKAKKLGRSADAHFESSAQAGFSATLATEDLSYVVEELIWNAFKFSSPSSPVKLKLETGVDGFSLAISNISLNTNLLAQVEPFKQIDRDTREQQGSGLGLYLCKKIAAIYNWQLTETKKADKVTISLQVTA